MAGLVERSDSRRYEMERKKYRRTILITSIIGILAVVLIFTYLLYAFFNKNYNSYDVVNKMKRRDSNTVKYLSYKSGILKYSRDGAEAMDAKGNVLWNGSYDLKDPQAKICGDYVAIADIGGKEVYVFNGKDSGSRLEVLFPILQVEVAKQGVVALLLEDETSSIISIQDPYDSSKPLKAEVPTNIATDGYPIDIAISEDGTKLVTSYFNVKNGVIESKVSFYDFGVVGSNKVNKLVGGKDFGKTLIPQVNFINSDTLCAYGEKNFSIFKNMEQPKEVYKESFDKEIKSIFSNHEYIGFVLENFDMDKKYTLLLYNTQGKKVLEKQINCEYNQVYLSGEEIIFYSNLECTILRLNGKEKFHVTFDKNINYFFSVNHFNTYLLIDDVNIEEIKLTEGQK